MKTLFPRVLGPAAALLLLAGKVVAANVPPSGYTNNFATQPPAADWATVSIAGGAGDAYAPDTDVNTIITAAGVTTQTTSNTGDPPAQLGTATWSSTGFYLQTRATGNRYTVLMGKFLNTTGTNATQIAVAYTFTVPAAGPAEDYGNRAYYSLTGLAGSWTNVPDLNSLASSVTSVTLSASVTMNWTNGGTLYLLWTDDNAAGAGAAGTDAGNQFDNFSLQVTAGAPPITNLTLFLTAPTNNALYVSGTTVTASASVLNGMAPHTVEYFVNGGSGYAAMGSSTNPPFQVSLGALPAGTYHLYAAVTDSAAVPLGTNSTTNVFAVADPIAVSLTAPAQDASFDNVTPVTGAVTISGGTVPYSVQFHLDDVATGSPVNGSPYEYNFGPLPVGNHTIRATVTDASGWSSNSAVHTVHITGPLAVTLSPTNGTAYNYGQPLILTALGGGGTAPYAVTLYLNEAALGPLTVPPFTTNLGILPPGTYNASVRITDSATPAPQQAGSATNVITILPNPLSATLTNPTNGQGAVSGRPFTLAASALVNLPLAVAAVEFFFNGASVGVDSNAPYSTTIAGPAPGGYPAYAVATDSLGRTSSTATNLVNFAIDPLANNHFTNRFFLSGTPVTVTGNNTGATTEAGEQTGGTGNGRGATLWWAWTAPATGTARMDTFGSTFNTVLAVYTGTAVNALTQLAINNNAPGLNNVSLLTFNATQGTEYQIQVAGATGFGQPAATGDIQLNIQMPPSVAITNPVAGSVFPSGSNFLVQVSASAAGGPVTKVDLYRSGTFAGVASNAPYAFLVSDAPPGSNALAAVVTDSLGQVATSAVVNVLVANPGITIVAPPDGAVFATVSPVTVSVFPYLASGSVTSVTFLVDGQLFAQDATPPFSGVWSNVTSGSHRLTASALDDAANTHVASPSYFAVAEPLVRSNAVWKYLADGSDQGTAWIAPAFNDGAWTNGPAELGYGDGDEATTVPSGPDGNFFVTTYFRHAFVVSNAAAFTNLSLGVLYDDAVAVYLNGVQILRTANLPAGAAYNTLATGQPTEEAVASVTIPASSLILGTNVLAAEIHQQALDSSDISFVLQLVGIPSIVRNLSPSVALTSPTKNAFFQAPPSITLEATASDSDNGISKVEFFANGVKLGEDTSEPYAFVWANPPVAAHVLTAVATDNQGAVATSEPVAIVVSDAAGRPVAAITSPLHGAIMEGPTNLLVTATAQAITGVTNVEFLANGVAFGSDDTAPYAVNWAAPFGTNVLTAVASDAGGVNGTSPPVTVVITIPPTNLIAPRIFTQIPLAEATVTNLTNITVIFSERVQNVDASDLLIDGRPATGLTGGGSNYTFHFPHPAYGVVDVAFANGHGITDFGYPSNLPFDEQGNGSFWGLLLLDRTAPTIAARTPAANTTVTNLSQVSVSFSEAVTGVDASDLLLNGTPAFDFSGSGTNYTFLVSQPPSGTVNVTWAVNHGIADVSDVTNAFNRTAPGSTWSFTLDSRTVLVQSNSAWRFVKGTNEASVPADAWRQPLYDDSAWASSTAPFLFGEITFTNAGIPGTDLGDMANNGYTSLFLRKSFLVPNAGAITNVLINHQSDDGFIAWINGVEVFRYNMPTGEVAYNGSAASIAPEAGFNSGAAYIVRTLTNAPSVLVSGTNFLAVQAFNFVTNPASSDFVFNAQVYTFLSDAGVTAPRLTQAMPAPGDVLALTNLTIAFSEGVTNVDAADLLVNGAPATAVASITNTAWFFSFPQPPYGPVTVTWDTNHGIVDFDSPPKPFDGGAPGSVLGFTLINPSNPRVAIQVPASGATVTGLTAVAITFTEPVSGVVAADLLVSGAPAALVSSTDNTTYNFTFPQPAFGSVAIRWATNHGIVDVEAGHAFDPTRFGGQWNYTLVNPVPAVTLTSPTNGGYILAPAHIPVRATATDNDGTIVSVEFFEGAASLGILSNAPYNLTRSNAVEGVYTFRAVATDNTGLSATSAPVSVSVVTNLPAFLTRGPYLQLGSPTGAVVRWRTDLPTDGVVLYGTDPAALTNMAVEPISTNNHIVAISGLQPETRYFYSIGSSGQRLAGTNGVGSDYWFDTHPVAGTPRPTRIWVLGDAGTAGNGTADRQNSTRDAFYNYAATNGGLPNLWLMLGDNAYNTGTDNEHQRAVFDIYPTLLRNRFIWPTIGNHETSQSTTTTDFPYLHIFSLPTAGQSGGVPSGTEKYYSFDYANVHFVCLDSMTSGRTAITPMAQWLQDDLAATTAEWIIVFFHHPPYTKGSHDSDAETDLIQIRQNLVPILEAHGVDLVLSGHSHCYERSFLLHGHYGNSGTLTPSMKLNGGDGRTDGTGAYKKNAAGEGVVYTVAGSAGQATFGTLNHPAHFISYLLLGSMVIDVSSNRLDAIFLDTAGATLDRFTLSKPVPGSPAVPLNLAARFTNHTAVRLDWTDAATNEQAYVVERSLDGTNFAGLVTLPANATSMLDSAVVPNTTYFYRVRATNSVAFSDYSNLASATTSNTPPIAAPDAYYRFVGQNLTIPVASLLANDRDADGDTVAFDSVSPMSAQGGTVNLMGQEVLYVPANGFNGSDSFSYTIADGHGAFGSALVTILISSNTPPQFAPLPNWILSVLSPLSLTNTAVDADQPTNRLTYSLEPGAPDGARVQTNSGRFFWNPSRAYANTTNRITVRATDDGAPPLSATTSFTVIVRDYVELTAGEAVLRAGDTSSVPVDVTATAGLASLQFAIRFTDGRLTNFTLEPLAPQLATSDLQTLGPGTALLSFTANPAAPLVGTHTLARLHFMAATGAISAFVPLELLNPVYVRAAEGLQPSALLNAGRATVIEAAPLVEAQLGTNGTRAVTLYGRVGVQYTVETSSGFSPIAWVPWTQVTLTNLYQPLALTNPPTPFLFIRARE